MSITKDEKLKRLESEHTKVLLSWLKSARACGGWWSPCGDSGSNFGYTTAELKAELAKRPHVPNKQESRQIRQRKAKGLV